MHFSSEHIGKLIFSYAIRTIAAFAYANATFAYSFIVWRGMRRPPNAAKERQALFKLRANLL